MIQRGDKIKVLDHGHVIFLDSMGSDRSIAEAAAVSYGGEKKTDEQVEKLLGYLYRNKHTSPFEMAKVQLNIKMPIFIARQYIRHRMQNVNEVSARYTELPNEFYIPDMWRAQAVKNKQSSVAVEEFSDGTNSITHLQLSSVLEDHCKQSYSLYEQMIAYGVAREMARMILPLNIYTEMQVCWDLKNLLHFVTLREDAHAQAEIQEYGRAIKSILVQLFPITMRCFEQYKFPMVEVGQ